MILNQSEISTLIHLINVAVSTKDYNDNGRLQLFELRKRLSDEANMLDNRYSCNCGNCSMQDDKECIDNS
jgi:hypothetical protein